MLKVLATAVLFACLCTGAMGQARDYPPLRSADPMQDKGFYLLTVLSADPAFAEAVRDDPTLSVLTQRQRARLLQAVETCAARTACYLAQATLSDAEIASTGEALAALARPGGPLARVVPDHLRPSGRFQRHAAVDDQALLAAAWIDTATAMNRLYRVYGLAETPRYAAIDSASFSPDDARFGALVATAFEVAADDVPAYDLFFESWARLGLDMLVLNQRDEAVRHEPLEVGENAAATVRARGMDWDRWPYSAILVPGAGNLPEERGLSAGGALRVRAAARRYLRGEAPFVIVSGGNVHPNKTPWNEAIEMKAALVAGGVPEDAIVIDPHARHTTTNLRNAVRLLYRLGAPMERPVMITTSRSQSAYIAGAVFHTRNQDELGYQPMIIGERVSPMDLTATPSLTSLHIDATDALDP